jgi:hypothetical protein
MLSLLPGCDRVLDLFPFPDNGKSVHLLRGPRELSPPGLTLTPASNLPVLGRDSGVCFVFGYGTTLKDSDRINAEAIGNLEFESIPFEASAVGPDGKLYKLSGASIGGSRESSNRYEAFACKQFCPCMAPPSEIRSVTIFPSRKVRVEKVFWRTDPDIAPAPSSTASGQGDR